MKMICNFLFVEVDEKQTNLLELDDILNPANLKIGSRINEGIDEVEFLEQDEMKAKSDKSFLHEL